MANMRMLEDLFHVLVGIDRVDGSMTVEVPVGKVSSSGVSLENGMTEGLDDFGRNENGMEDRSMTSDHRTAAALCFSYTLD